MEHAFSIESAAAISPRDVLKNLPDRTDPIGVYLFSGCRVAGFKKHLFFLQS
jgi:hypothetical protein